MQTVYRQIEVAGQDGETTDKRHFALVVFHCAGDVQQPHDFRHRPECTQRNIANDKSQQGHVGEYENSYHNFGRTLRG